MSDPSDRSLPPEHEPGADADPGMDPGTEQAVRDLLASAGPAEPMPPEVAARLDATLADLSAGRTPGPTAPSGDADDELAERRAGRQRRWPQVLVAAATVGVLGVAVGNVVDLGGLTGGSGDASTSAGVADRGAAGAAPESLPESAPSAGGDRTGDGFSAQSRVPVLRLRSASLAADVQRVEDLALATPVSEGWRGACVVPAAAPGASWAEARLDGDRALLLLRPPEQGRRVADVYRCPSARSGLRSDEQGSDEGSQDPAPTSGRPGPPVASTTVLAR